MLKNCIKIISAYIFNQLLQDITQDEFLIDKKLIWIKSFLSHEVVA